MIEARTFRTWLGEDGIVRVVVAPNAEQTLADAQEAVAASARVALGRRLLLIDMRAMKSLERAARDYYAGEQPARSFTAVALLVYSPVSRVIANFFMGLSRPLIPTRMFTDEKQALQWLKTHARDS